MVAEGSKAKNDGSLLLRHFFVRANIPPMIPSTGPTKNPLIVSGPTIEAIKIPITQTLALAGFTWIAYPPAIASAPAAGETAPIVPTAHVK
jgi:hypothetical protein